MVGSPEEQIAAKIRRETVSTSLQECSIGHGNGISNREFLFCAVCHMASEVCLIALRSVV